MTDGGAASHGRPLCRCHGQPMDTWTRSDGTAGSACAVKRRARQRAAYATDPATENYARTRRALRARIAVKRRRIEELEQQ